MAEVSLLFLSLSLAFSVLKRARIYRWMREKRACRSLTKGETGEKKGSSENGRKKIDDAGQGVYSPTRSLRRRWNET